MLMAALTTAGTRSHRRSGDSAPDNSVARTVLAEHDDALLAAYLDGATAAPYGRLRGELAAQARQMLVHPVFFGSAITGVGVRALSAGLTELLPSAQHDSGGPVSGAVFKVQRGAAGEKIAYTRMFSGTVRVWDRLEFGPGHGGRITTIRVFGDGTDAPWSSVAAGQIAKLGPH
jgi:ribosomal protection tetracycline resistance protein